MPAQIVSMADGLRYSLTQGISRFMAFIPTLVGAIVVLVVGWIVSRWVGRLVEKGLKLAGMERVTQRAGLHEQITRVGEGWSASRFIGELAKWFLRLIFIQAAANILSMPQITAIVNSIILFIPKLAVAALIMVVGVFAARWLSDLVQASTNRISKAEGGNVFSVATKYGIIGFACIAALSQLQIASVIVNGLYLGLIASLSLAFGLAFGLGGRGVASEITGRWYGQSKGTVTRIQAKAASAAPSSQEKVDLPPTGTI